MLYINSIMEPTSCLLHCTPTHHASIGDEELCDEETPIDETSDIEVEQPPPEGRLLSIPNFFANCIM